MLGWAKGSNEIPGPPSPLPPSFPARPGFPSIRKDCPSCPASPAFHCCAPQPSLTWSRETRYLGDDHNAGIDQETHGAQPVRGGRDASSPPATRPFSRARAFPAEGRRSPAPFASSVLRRKLGRLAEIGNWKSSPSPCLLLSFRPLSVCLLSPSLIYSSRGDSGN